MTPKTIPKYARRWGNIHRPKPEELEDMGIHHMIDKDHCFALKMPREKLQYVTRERCKHCKLNDLLCSRGTICSSCKKIGVSCRYDPEDKEYVSCPLENDRPGWSEQQKGQIDLSPGSSSIMLGLKTLIKSDSKLSVKKDGSSPDTLIDCYIGPKEENNEHEPTLLVENQPTCREIDEALRESRPPLSVALETTNLLPISYNLTPSRESFVIEESKQQTDKIEEHSESRKRKRGPQSSAASSSKILLAENIRGKDHPPVNKQKAARTPYMWSENKEDILCAVPTMNNLVDNLSATDQGTTILLDNRFTAGEWEGLAIKLTVKRSLTHPSGRSQTPNSLRMKELNLEAEPIDDNLIDLPKDISPLYEAYKSQYPLIVIADTSWKSFIYTVPESCKFAVLGFFHICSFKKVELPLLDNLRKREITWSITLEWTPSGPLDNKVELNKDGSPLDSVQRPWWLSDDDTDNTLESESEQVDESEVNSLFDCPVWRVESGNNILTPYSLRTSIITPRILFDAKNSPLRRESPSVHVWLCVKCGKLNETCWLGSHDCTFCKDSDESVSEDELVFRLPTLAIHPENVRDYLRQRPSWAPTVSVPQDVRVSTYKRKKNGTKRFRYRILKEKVEKECKKDASISIPSDDSKNAASPYASKSTLLRIRIPGRKRIDNSLARVGGHRTKKLSDDEYEHQHSTGPSVSSEHVESRKKLPRGKQRDTDKKNYQAEPTLAQQSIGVIIDLIYSGNRPELEVDADNLFMKFQEDVPMKLEKLPPRLTCGIFTYEVSPSSSSSNTQLEGRTDWASAPTIVHKARSLIIENGVRYGNRTEGKLQEDFQRLQVKSWLGESPVKTKLHVDARLHDVAFMCLGADLELVFSLSEEKTGKKKKAMTKPVITKTQDQEYENTEDGLVEKGNTGAGTAAAIWDVGIQEEAEAKKSTTSVDQLRITLSHGCSIFISAGEVHVTVIRSEFAILLQCHF